VTARSLDLADALFVVGMRREARILGAGRRVQVGAHGLAEALAARPPAAVISFGLCGALSRRLAYGDLVLATGVIGGGATIDTDSALAGRLCAGLPQAIRGPVAGSPVIVGEAREKAGLAASTGAIAVDMESHLVARAALASRTPFAVLRAVSDRAADSLPAAAKAGFRPDGAVDVLAVIAALLRRPGDLPGLIHTAQGAGAGFRALALASRTLDAVARR
jgi:nucleoside phosphorylase